MGSSRAQPQTASAVVVTHRGRHHPPCPRAAALGHAEAPGSSGVDGRRRWSVVTSIDGETDRHDDRQVYDAGTVSCSQYGHEYTGGTGGMGSRDIETSVMEQRRHPVRGVVASHSAPGIVPDTILGTPTLFRVQLSQPTHGYLLGS